MSIKTKDANLSGAQFDLRRVYRREHPESA